LLFWFWFLEIHIVIVIVIFNNIEWNQKSFLKFCEVFWIRLLCFSCYFQVTIDRRNQITKTSQNCLLIFWFYFYPTPNSTDVFFNSLLCVPKWIKILISVVQLYTPFTVPATFFYVKTYSWVLSRVKMNHRTPTSDLLTTNQPLAALYRFHSMCRLKVVSRNFTRVFMWILNFSRKNECDFRVLEDKINKYTSISVILLSTVHIHDYNCDTRSSALVALRSLGLQ